jgi:hypothetical protein
MPKREFKTIYRELYQPPTEPVTVDVPAMNFIMIDGSGDPETDPWYQQVVEALYAVGYSIKFILKERSEDLDFVMPPLEGLWWAEDMAAFTEAKREDWQWTMMLMIPEPVDDEMYLEGHKKACETKCLVAADLMRFERFEEGLSAQIMHRGSYAEEGPTVQRLHAFIAEQGHRPRGKHHEIYLSDPRRAKPESMKTVIRQPVG